MPDSWPSASSRPHGLCSADLAAVRAALAALARSTGDSGGVGECESPPAESTELRQSSVEALVVWRGGRESRLPSAPRLQPRPDEEDDDLEARIA